MQTSPTPTTTPAMSHSALKGRSMSKARVYWANPTPGTTGQADYYSFDTSGRYKVDPDKQRQYGIDGLVKMVDKLGAKVARCIIYDQRPGISSANAIIQVKAHGSWN